MPTWSPACTPTSSRVPPEAGRAFVEFPVGEAPVARDDGGAVAGVVDDGFEQVGEVEFHALTLERKVRDDVTLTGGWAGWMQRGAGVSRRVVATPHYLATNAGLEMLAAGGNALDAALAANLVLGVVSPYLCGYGGDVLAIVWDGSLHGYRGVGRSPAAATITGVLERHDERLGPRDTMPTFGPHAVTVPGTPRGWFDLLDRWGSRSFGDLATSALRYARDGFPLTRRGAATFRATRDLFAHFGLDDFGAAYPEVAPGRDRAATGARSHDRDAGERRAGGVLRRPDRGCHRRQAARARFVHVDRRSRRDTKVRGSTPMRARFAGREIAELPPPTQGVTALEALRIVDGFDLPGPGAVREHLLIEAAKSALADRNLHVGDPDAMALAAEELIADDWVARRRATIDPDRASIPVPDPGPDGGTAYLCAADRDGLLVSLIQTNFTAAGAGLHVPEWGINLQNRGSSFRLEPGHVNALAGAKLPMHTLIPALALRDGRPGARVRRDGRAHAGPDPSPAPRPHVRRRRRPASGNHRAAMGRRSRDLAS